MTLTEALPMMKNGLSLYQLQQIAEKQRTTVQSSNVVNFTHVRAMKSARIRENFED